MRLASIILFLPLLASAQALPSQWFVTNFADSTTSQVCFTPGSNVISSGLTMTVATQTLTCGNSSSAQASHTHTGARLVSSASYGPFGVIQFTVTTGSQLSHNLWSVAWLEGVNCNSIHKINPGLSTGTCNWDHPGSDEIDLFEQDTTLFNNHANGAIGPCTTSPCFDHNIHSTSTSAQSYWGNVAANTTYTVVMNWVDSTHMSFYVNNALTWTTTGTVPSSAMFIILDARLNTLSNSGMTFPFTEQFGYFRWCPVGTVDGPGGTPGCNAGHASIFDEEFTGTGPRSDIYVAQTYAGNNTGADCANAYGLMNNGQSTFPNDPGYWVGNTGVGIVGPGSTVHVCGTTTTPVLAQGDGTSGSHITINFEAGATGSASANGHNFIDITGGPASVWYVDSSVGSSGDGTSWATAWKDITNITGVNGGDTVYFSGGASGASQTYNVPAANWTPAGGTSGHPVTYAVGQDSLHNGTVVISTSFAHWMSPGGGFAGYTTWNGNVGGSSHMQAAVTGTGLTSEWVVISNVSGVTFQYLTFPAGDAFNFATVNNYDIDNCTMHATSDHAMKITLTPPAGAYGANVIHDNYMLLDQDSAGSGLGVDGIQSAISVDIYNNQFIANPTTYAGSQHQDAWQTFSGPYSRFYDNSVVSMSNSGVFIEPEANTDSIQVYNNLVYMNTNLHAGGLQEGIQITAQAGGWTVTNILVANNTIVNFGNKCLYAPQQNSVAFDATTVFVNNVCYGSPISITGTGITQTTNGYYTSGGASLFKGYADPISTPYIYNFVPAPGSALIAAGTNLTSLGVFTTDYAGVGRPSVAAWDLGAYQASAPANSLWSGTLNMTGAVTVK